MAPEGAGPAETPTELTADIVARRLQTLHRRDHALMLVTAFAFVFIATLNIVALQRISDNGDGIRQVVEDNRVALRDRIGAKDAAIAERDQTIADQKAVIDQAVAAIIQMADQIEALGGKPPRVVLKPPERKEPAP